MCPTSDAAAKAPSAPASREADAAAGPAKPQSSKSGSRASASESDSQSSRALYPPASSQYFATETAGLEASADAEPPTDSSRLQRPSTPLSIDDVRLVFHNATVEIHMAVETPSADSADAVARLVRAAGGLMRDSSKQVNRPSSDVVLRNDIHSGRESAWWHREDDACQIDVSYGVIETLARSLAESDLLMTNRTPQRGADVLSAAVEGVRAFLASAASADSAMLPSLGTEAVMQSVIRSFVLRDARQPLLSATPHEKSTHPAYVFWPPPADGDPVDVVGGSRYQSTIPAGIAVPGVTDFRLREGKEIPDLVCADGFRFEFKLNAPAKDVGLKVAKGDFVKVTREKLPCDFFVYVSHRTAPKNERSTVAFLEKAFRSSFVNATGVDVAAAGLTYQSRSPVVIPLGSESHHGSLTFDIFVTVSEFYHQESGALFPCDSWTQVLSKARNDPNYSVIDAKGVRKQMEFTKGLKWKLVG